MTPSEVSDVLKEEGSESRGMLYTAIFLLWATDLQVTEYLRQYKAEELETQLNVAQYYLYKSYAMWVEKAREEDIVAVLEAGFNEYEVLMKAFANKVETAPQKIGL